MFLEAIHKHELSGGKMVRTIKLYVCVQSRSTFCDWIVAHQAHLSVGFPRQESWSGLSFPPPGDPNPWIKTTSPVSLALQVDSLSAEPLGKPAKL